MFRPMYLDGSVHDAWSLCCAVAWWQGRTLYQAAHRGVVKEEQEH